MADTRAAVVRGTERGRLPGRGCGGHRPGPVRDERDRAGEEAKDRIAQITFAISRRLAVSPDRPRSVRK